MEFDDVRWSVRREDALRALGFLVAVVLASSSALALWAFESESSRVFPLLFTAICLAGGATFGLVLSFVQLASHVRVEGRDATVHSSV